LQRITILRPLYRPLSKKGAHKDIKLLYLVQIIEIMATVSFVLKDKAAPESLVLMYVRFDGKRIKYSTKEKINPEYWLQSENRAKRSKYFTGFNAFNSRLDHFKNKTITALRKLQDDGKVLNPATVKLALDKEFNRTTKTNTHDLFSFIKTGFGKTTHKGKFRNEGSLKSYAQLYKLLKEYQMNRRTSLTYENLDLNFYDDFLDFLTYDKEHSINNIGKHISRLKAIMNKAFQLKHHTNLEYKNFSTPTEEVKHIYLTEQEIQTIYELDLVGQEKDLKLTRDVFVLQCYVGLRYSDLKRLEPEMLKENKLVIQTQKTGRTVTIPLHPLVKQIIAKYETKLPKPFVNQVMNRHLKEIGKLAGINGIELMTKKIKNESITTKKKRYELISTHTARRSFATNMYKIGVPSKAIMAITGHKKESTFENYIKLSGEEYADIMDKTIQENYSPLKIAN